MERTMTRKYAFQIAIAFLIGFILSFAWSAAHAETFDNNNPIAPEWNHEYKHKWMLTSFIRTDTGKHDGCMLATGWNLEGDSAKQARTIHMGLLLIATDAGAFKMSLQGKNWKLSDTIHDVTITSVRGNDTFLKWDLKAKPDRGTDLDMAFDGWPGPLLNELKAADAMMITIKGQTVGVFNLVGSADAINGLYSCVEKGSRSEGTF